MYLSRRGGHNMYDDHGIINVMNTIETIHIELTGLVLERAHLNDQAKDLWKIINRDETNHKEEMHFFYNSMGAVTHRINILISRLSGYSGNHEAVTLAVQYVESELTRNRGIHDYRTWLQREVQRGNARYRSSEGWVSDDPTLDLEYIAHKEEQVIRAQAQLAALREVQNRVTTDGARPGLSAREYRAEIPSLEEEIERFSDYEASGVVDENTREMLQRQFEEEQRMINDQTTFVETVPGINEPPPFIDPLTPEPVPETEIIEIEDAETDALLEDDIDDYAPLEDEELAGSEIELTEREFDEDEEELYEELESIDDPFDDLEEYDNYADYLRELEQTADGEKNN